MTPIAMAMPPSDMMLEVMPNSRMKMNAMSTATGISMMTRSTLRTCSRKSSTMRLTTMDSSISARRSVIDGRLIRVVRS